MSAGHLTSWLYVAAFIGAGAALVVVILVTAAFVNPKHPNAEKLSTYECGIVPVGDSWQPFAVRYYIFALMFLIFDIEAVYLFPWALVFRDLGAAGFIEAALFLVVLGVGLVYAWRKGALNWA